MRENKGKEKMATLLFSRAIEDVYKEVSEVIKPIDVTNKDVRVKTIKQMMNESFFHGASKFGDNFIA